MESRAVIGDIYNELGLPTYYHSHYWPQTEPSFLHHTVIHEPLNLPKLNRVRLDNNQAERPIIVLHFDPRKSSAWVEKDRYTLEDVYFEGKTLNKTVHLWHLTLRQYQNGEKYDVYILDHMFDFGS